MAHFFKKESIRRLPIFTDFVVGSIQEIIYSSVSKWENLTANNFICPKIHFSTKTQKHISFYIIVNNVWYTDIL